MALRGQTIAAVGEKVAHGDDIDVRVILKAKGGAEAAHAVADDSHADLAVALRLPDGLFIGVGIGFVETGDRLFLSEIHRPACHGQRRGTEGARQEGTSRECHDGGTFL